MAELAPSGSATNRAIQSSFDINIAREGYLWHIPSCQEDEEDERSCNGEVGGCVHGRQPPPLAGDVVLTVGLHPGDVVLTSGLYPGDVVLTAGLYPGDVVLSAGLHPGDVVLTDGLYHERF